MSLLIPPKQVLAVVVTRIGDTLLGTPALRAIKETWPAARLTVFAHPGRSGVLEGLTYIDNLKGYSALEYWKSFLPTSPKFDVGFVFHGDRKKVAFALRQAKQVYSHEVPASFDSNRLVAFGPTDMPLAAVDDRLRLVRSAGADTLDYRLNYVVFEHEKSWAKDYLRESEVRPSDLKIALQLKGFPTKSNRDWPIESFGELVARIVGRYPSARILITGDADSTAEACFLKSRFSESIIDLTGKCSLRETAALIGEMSLYVGPDTGPTHLAGALGVPMVGIYRASVPGHLMAPRGHPMCRVIEHPRTGCPEASSAPMSEISVETVWSAVDELLGQLAAYETGLMAPGFSKAS